jgi:hypothetical protein
MPRPPKNKPIPEPVVPVVAAPSIPAAVAPAALNFKAPPVIDVDQFIRVRDSVSHITFCFHHAFPALNHHACPRAIASTPQNHNSWYQLGPTQVFMQHMEQNKPHYACFHLLARVA